MFVNTILPYVEETIVAAYKFIFKTFSVKKSTKAMS